jgi:hypothetical protein
MHSASNFKMFLFRVYNRVHAFGLSASNSGLFSSFQMIYVLCVYNQKEKEHQITVSFNASILIQNRTHPLFIKRIQLTDGCSRYWRCTGLEKENRTPHWSGAVILCCYPIFTDMTQLLQTWKMSGEKSWISIVHFDILFRLVKKLLILH